MSARLFKRGQVWFCWVPKPGGGTRKVTTECTDRKAAEMRAAQLEREAVDPAYAAANKATTVAACEAFAASRVSRGRAAGTLHHYGVKLGHVIRLMPARLADVDAAACERFIATRLGEGAAQSTVKKEIRALGAMLRHVKRLGLYTRDLDEVIPELEDTYEPKTRFLQPLEFVALASALPPERAAHLVFIVCTGARWGESVRARRSDIDGVMVRLRGTKTKLAAGVVPVPPVLRGALAWALANAPGDDVLFTSWGNVRRDISVACRHIGIEPVTPNDLRRTFATWLAVSGVTPDIVGKALRHTTSRMAELVYGRIAPGDLDRLISERGPALMIEKKTVEPALYPKGDGLLMGGDMAETGVSGVSVETPVPQEKPGFLVPRDGIEPPTRGFSTLVESPETSANRADSAPAWAANGLTFRQRARRWFAREAA